MQALMHGVCDILLLWAVQTGADTTQLPSVLQINLWFDRKLQSLQNKRLGSMMRMRLRSLARHVAMLSLSGSNSKSESCKLLTPIRQFNKTLRLYTSS